MKYATIKIKIVIEHGRSLKLLQTCLPLRRLPLDQHQMQGLRAIPWPAHGSWGRHGSKGRRLGKE